MKSKRKTNKTLLKRIKITGRNKLLRRASKQRHFLAKDPGQKTRSKRLSRGFSPANRKSIRKLIY